MINSTVKHYLILEKLGEGGMGVVYQAYDTRLERPVALKFLSDKLADDPGLRQRFLREARAASALNHPNICTIYEIGEDNGQVFLAMEFLDGKTLKDLVRDGPLPYQHLLKIAEDVSDGLEAAHKAGVIHRDVKLANIFVTKNGATKILDFGLAKKTQQESRAETSDPESALANDETHLTSGLAALGTAAYMSPEQALGRSLDNRTDLFSFGIVLYEMATGQAPFRGDTTGVLLLSIVQETPPAPRALNPDIPEGLQKIIQKCLEKDRELRYRTAGEIRTDLQHLRTASASESIPSSEPPGAQPSSEAAGTAVTSPERDAGRSLDSGRKPPARSFLRVASSAAVAIALLIAGILFLRSRNAHSFTPHDKVVVADFTNTTDDTIFDGTLRQAVATDLGQSPFVYVVSNRAISDALKQMAKPADARLTREVAREVCLRTNSRAYVAGSITEDGQQYQIALEALNCETDAIIASARARAAGRNAVIVAVGNAGQDLRRDLGESLPSIQQHGKPLMEATTSSLEALQAFTEGQTLRQQQGDEAGLPYIKRAVELDPNFAQAYAVLGTIYQNLAQNGLANQAFTSAYQLRNRVGERERYLIESTYFESVTGEASKARQIAENWIRDFPGDAMPRFRLARQDENLGQYDQAALQLRESIRLDPNSYPAYSSLMMAYMQLNKLDESKAIYEAAKAHHIDSEYLSRARFYVAFIERDDRTMQALLDAGKGKPGYEDRLGVEAALAAAYFGRLAEAEKMFSQAIGVANSMNAKESAAEHNAGLAFIEAEVGNTRIARTYAETALAISPNLSVKARSSLALAQAGDEVRAEQLADELGSQYPVGTIMQGYTLPTIRATIAINRKSPAKAIELLEAALPYELAMSSFANEQPAYERGLAYLESGDGPKAAAEFRKLIANPGVVTSSITGALAHLQLARAEQMSGNREQAKTDYQDFLALWKDADPKIPILQQAKAEYTALNRLSELRHQPHNYSAARNGAL